MTRARRPRRLPFVFAFSLAAAFLVSPVRADDAPAGRRYALLVGVKNYGKDQLRSLMYTENDVNDLAAVLKDGGYKRVMLLTQAEAAARGDNDLMPTARNVRRQLTAILDDRKPGDSVLVAFSGHGVQFRDQKDSYFCPMDAELDDLKTLISLGEVYQGLESCSAGVKVLLVDACRNDPQAEASKAVEKVKLESVTRPQAERPPGGVAALFSCSEGQKSFESEKLGHGVFFHFVIEGLKGKAANKKDEVNLAGLAQYVQDEVPDAVKDVSTTARQRPQLVSNLSGSALLVRAGAGRSGEVIENTIGMKLAAIASGTFFMGSPADEKGRRDDEAQHEVEITRPFFIGCCPVSRGQFRQFVKAQREGFKTQPERNGGAGAYDLKSGAYDYGPKNYWDNPPFGQEDDHPVVMVSWNDANDFCRWLSHKEGATYRLPTEAEWEYAARAGTRTRFWSGDRDEDLRGVANVADAALRRRGPDLDWCAPWDDGYAFTSPVGKFRANPWGLYDVHGNVWQWCADWYGKDYYLGGDNRDPAGPAEGTYRVIRGGSWTNEPKSARSAYRWRSDPNKEAFDNTGFRVVRVR